MLETDLVCKEVTVKLVQKRNIKYQLNSPSRVVDIARKVITQNDREHFVVLCLDVKKHLNSVNLAHVGSLNSTPASPREIFKVAILSNAASIICVHNHPSGDPTPSEEDRHAAQALREIGAMLDIDLVDFIILGDWAFSFAEEGLLPVVPKSRR